MNASTEQIVDAITLLKGDIGFLAFNLPQLESKYVEAVDVEIARAKAANEKFNENFPGSETLSNYKSKIRDELLGACRLGDERKLSLDSCRRIAASLGHGIGLPKPYDFVLDAIVELDRLIDAVQYQTKDDDDCKYPGLKQAYRDAQQNTKLAKPEKSYGKVAERYWETLDRNDRPPKITLRRWLERPGNH